MGKAKKEDENNFSVDKSAQQAESDKMNAHLTAGGVLGVCPEGKMNKNPKALSPFRFGAFQQAIDHRAPVYCFALEGCSHFWPLSASVGGFPCKMGVTLHKLAEPTGGEDAATLAADCQAKMQAHVDALRIKLHGPGNDPYPVASEPKSGKQE